MAFQIAIAGAEQLASVQYVTQVGITRLLYGHSRVQLTVQWDEHDRYDTRSSASVAARLLECPLTVTWRDNDLGENILCFQGYIDAISTSRDASHSYLHLSGVSQSQKTDLLRRNRAFQATTLLAIAEHIQKTEPLFKIDNGGDLSKVKIELSYQDETDFAYLQRMCHAYAVPFAVDDLTGQVHMGARGKDAGRPFPDTGWGWQDVAFYGSLPPTAQAASGSSGPTGVARGAHAAFVGRFNRKAADYHPTPEHAPIQQNVDQTTAHTHTSGYHLVAAGMVLPFGPGHLVGFEGGQHLIRSVRIAGGGDDGQHTTATQTYDLQAQPLPLGPAPQRPEWEDRSVWAWVVDNEHDPLQQGRIQIEFDCEELDPMPGMQRKWIHTLTPYGGGTAGGREVSAYAGVYSLPEPGDKVLVNFVGHWDNDAVIMGVVRHTSQGKPLNAHHTKRWRTPSGNEITQHTQGGANSQRMKVTDNLVLEAHNDGGGNTHVALICHSSEPNSLQISVGDKTIVELRGGKDTLIYTQNDMTIKADKHMHIEAESITMRSTGTGGIMVESFTHDISINAMTTKLVMQAGNDLTAYAFNKLAVQGGHGVDIHSASGPARLQGGTDILLNVDNIANLPTVNEAADPTVKP